MRRATLPSLLFLLLSNVTAHGALRRIFNYDGPWAQPGFDIRPWAERDPGPRPEPARPRTGGWPRGGHGPGPGIDARHWEGPGSGIGPGGASGGGFGFSIGGPGGGLVIDVGAGGPGVVVIPGAGPRPVGPQAAVAAEPSNNTVDVQQLSKDIANPYTALQEGQVLSRLFAKANRTQVVKAIGLAEDMDPDVTSTVLALALEYSARSGEPLPAAAVIVEASNQGGSTQKAVVGALSKSVASFGCTYLTDILWLSQRIASSTNTTQALFTTAAQAHALPCLVWPPPTIPPPPPPGPPTAPITLAPLTFPTYPGPSPPTPPTPEAPPASETTTPSPSPPAVPPVTFECPGDNYTLAAPIPFAPAPGILIGPADSVACVNLSDSGSYMSGVWVNAGSPLPSRPFIIGTTNTAAAWIMAVIDAGYIKMVGLQFTLWQGYAEVYASGARFKEMPQDAALTSTGNLTRNAVVEAWQNNTGSAPEGLVGYYVSTLALKI